MKKSEIAHREPASTSAIGSYIPWSRIVELAEHIDREHTARDVIDADIALRLVRAVLQFQEQLVAGMVRSPRGA